MNPAAILIFFSLFQSSPDIIGKWEQINPDRIGFKETMEFMDDSVAMKEEFFSKNRFEVRNNNLIVTKNDPGGKKETVIESKFSVKKDTLIFSKDNGKIKDKMIRISGSKSSNNLFGLWKGKTDKGIITYLFFNRDGTSTYSAVIRFEKFKYSISRKGMIIFIRNNPRIIEYELKDDSLKIFYKDTGEEFNYRRIKRED